MSTIGQPERAVFSDANIQQAILSCSQLFSPKGNEQ